MLTNNRIPTDSNAAEIKSTEGIQVQSAKATETASPVIRNLLVPNLNKPKGKVAQKPASLSTKGKVNDAILSTAKKQPKTANKPVANKPVANKPVANKPVANKPVANKPKTSHTTKNSQKNPVLHIIPLGGLDEIGKNCTVYEYNDEMIIIDCGLAFPDDDMPGVDIVIPDVSYLVKNQDKIRGIFITHGHEDHIGALPYLLREIKAPIYGTRLTIGLIEGKLKEHSLDKKVKLFNMNAGDTIKAGPFSVEFIHVNHSIPDAVAMAITSPAGTVIHMGDFKIDSTPIDGKIIDLARLAELGKKGVLALLADSTNAERPGFTSSERTVGEAFFPLFNRAENKRILVATFSSNIHRIQQIVSEAIRCGRKVIVSGRSMINVVSIGMQLGYLKIPDGVLIDIDEMRNYPPEKLVMITTGSQGEPMSALHRMSHGDHRKVSVGPGDMIIISANPIPGNEKTVSNVVNDLIKLGAEVIYEKMYDVHVSGHACQEELKMILALTNPKYFIPVHGEQKHLRKHADLAQSVGVDKKNILIPEIGKVIEITQKQIKFNGIVQSGRILVDGLGVGDVGSIVLRDRKHLAEDGIIVAVMTIDSASGDVVAGPDIVSRGFVYVRESEELMLYAKRIILKAIDSTYRLGERDWSGLKAKVRDDLSRYLYERTKRSPMILPIIMEI